MATKTGTKVLIKVDSGLLVGQNTLDFSSVANMVEISNKTSGKYAEFEQERITQTVSVGGIASSSKEATNKGYWELLAAQAAGEAVTIVFTEFTDVAATTEEVGAEELTASAFISSLDVSFPDNDSNSFTCDFQITGSPTVSTNV